MSTEGRVIELKRDGETYQLELTDENGCWIVPLSVGQVRSLQEAIARELPDISTERNSASTTSKKIEDIERLVNAMMVRLPPGVLYQGSMPSALTPADELPRHASHIRRPYSLTSIAVTQGLYTLVMDHNPVQQMLSVLPHLNDLHLVDGTQEEGDDAAHPFLDHRKPVVYVSWLDAVRFCNKLSQLLGKDPVYELTQAGVQIHPTNGYRLPTEAEWEYAARARDDLRYVGSDHSTQVAWVKSNSGGYLHRVGQKQPNQWGFFDMSGNVWEWCEDWKGDYPTERVFDYVGPYRGVERVCRGGSFEREAWFSRTTCRFSAEPGARLSAIGFRIACSHL